MEPRWRERAVEKIAAALEEFWVVSDPDCSFEEHAAVAFDALGVEEWLTTDLESGVPPLFRLHALELPRGGR